MEGEALYEFLHDAVVKQGEFTDPEDTFRQIVEHGADTGWGGFTTYQETGEFYEKYKSEIWDLLYETKEALGEKNILAMIAGFKTADTAETVESFENLLAWFTLEEIARWATEEDEEENPDENGPDDNPKKKKELSDMDKLVRKHWDIKSLAADLGGEDWEQTEPHRIDRRTFVGSIDNIEELAKEAVSEQELADAEKDDTLLELLEDVSREYVDALGEAVAEVMGEHVYGELYEGDVFVGQYEDGDIAELEEKGYKIRR